MTDVADDLAVYTSLVATFQHENNALEYAKRLDAMVVDCSTGKVLRDASQVIKESDLK